MSIESTRGRRAAAILVGLIAATAVGASAASLGGIDSNDLGAETGVVASCDTNGVEVRYRTGYHRRSEQFRVNRVIVRNVSAECEGLPFQLTLFSNDGSTVEASGDSLVVRNIRDRQPGPGVDMAGVARITVRMPAESIDGIALLIGGTASTP